LKSAETLESYLATLPPNPAFSELFRTWGIHYRWFAVGTIVAGNIAAMLAGTIINVAIPNIMGAFGISQTDAQWLSTANLTASTVAMLTSSWLVRTIGMRDTTLLAMLLFLAGSVLGGTAGSTDVMIFARAMQGVTAGLLTPLSMTIIFQVFPPGRQGLAMGTSAVGVILAPTIGPAIGGLLIDALNWRYVFFLGVPFSLLAIICTFAFLPGRTGGARIPFDWNGFLLLNVALVALLVGLSNGQREGWDSDYIISCLVVAAVFSACFVWWQLRVEYPLLDLGLFANRQFAIMALNGFVFGGGLFASSYLVPLFLQMVQHLSATSAGALMIPPGIAMLLLFPFAGRLADTMDHRVLIGSGILCSAVSFWLMAGADANTAFWTFVWWNVLNRIGVSLVMPAIQMGAMTHIEVSRLTQASASFNFIRQLGGAFGVNLMSVALDRSTAQHADYLLSTQTWGSGDTLQTLGLLRQLALAIGYSGTEAWNAARALLQGLVQQEALAAGFRDAFGIVVVAFLLTLIPTLMLGSKRPRPA
jgi:DHA2 family multidrug resistance protein